MEADTLRGYLKGREGEMQFLGERIITTVLTEGRLILVWTT